MTWKRHVAAVSLAMAVCVPALNAQVITGAAEIDPAAAAESLAILARLDTAVATNTQDAASWHRRGMLAWALSIRARGEPPIAGLDANRLSRAADTSLRIAAQLEPTNAAYRLQVGKFLLSSGNAITRSAAATFFREALEIARASNDSAQLAETAIEAGRTHWRRYDALANRRIVTSPAGAIRTLSDALRPVSGDDAGPTGITNSLDAVRNALALATQELPPDVAGNDDYAAAEALFRDALTAVPSHPRAFRQLAMVMAERNRWQELTLLSRNRIGSLPWDPWPWLTLGLATYRGGDSRAAAAAFDSALKRMSPAERDRFDRMERILRTKDQATMNQGSVADQLAKRRLYWLFADPLWTRDGNESRVEFLARVTFAELRWTVDELGIRGADTDRGNIYIRYGPPDVIASFGAEPTPGATEIAIIWAYARGFMFAFNAPPMYATARVPLEDRAMVEELIEQHPVRWDNIADFKLDSMSVDVARFRAGDSVDVMVAANPPISEIRASTEIANSSARTDFWLLRGGTVPIAHDSARVSSSGVRKWTGRVSRGNYVYRLEATIENGTRAARAVAPFVADNDAPRDFWTRGFGLSDLVLASEIEPRAGSPIRRWSDLDFTPIVDGTVRNGRVGLVWENYEFASDTATGGVRYQIAVTLERRRSAAGRIVASVVGALAGAVGVDQSEDRLTIRFERSAAAEPAFVDHLMIELGETPAGTYGLTLEVTDLTSGGIATRRETITIVR